jgi:nitrile hydratase
MSRFSAGEAVRIRAQETLAHQRVPGYAQGRTGVVERVLTDFVIPEDDAWGRLWQGGRRETLYRVRLHQTDTWPGYRGSAADAHELEIFEHWLEPVKETS